MINGINANNDQAMLIFEQILDKFIWPNLT